MTEQRGHIDGAALFSTLPRARNPSLLRLLVAYEIIWDFLDNLNERTSNAGVLNGLQLHQALIDALDHDQTISDFYEHSPQHDDAGYLRSLTTSCRDRYTRLPSHRTARQAAVHESIRAQVCAINHDPDPLRRDRTLRHWAAAEFPAGHEARWFELTAAASTDLTIFALLALATEPTCGAERITQISTAYFPWVSILTAMLDSYVDQAEDATTGNHSYLAHYVTAEFATQRICTLIRRCLREANSLPNAAKHVVIATSMCAMYLTKDSAMEPSMRETTACLIRGGGSLTRLLCPALRLWRIAYGLRDA